MEFNPASYRKDEAGSVVIYKCNFLLHAGIIVFIFEEVSATIVSSCRDFEGQTLQKVRTDPRRS